MPTIMLDPGHGGSDPGASQRGNLEKDLNLSIALRTRDYLRENYDVKVSMTRTTDTTVSLAARTNRANRENVDYYCSIHINAGGGRGWESYIYNGPVSSQTVRAQQTLHKYVMSVISKYGARDRGIKRANFHVLRETKMPAILLENLFVDTTADLNLLRDKSFLNILGDAIGEGLARALSLKKLAKPKDPEKPDTGMYYVIAGSFASRKNAETRSNMLKKNNVEAIIKTTKVGNATRYRVQAGAFRNKKSAEQRRNVIRNLGIKDAYVTADS